MTELPASSRGAERSTQARSGFAMSSITLGAVVAVLTLVVYQWVLFAVGIPLRIFFLLAALFVAQAVFNGVVLACCFGELSRVPAIDAAARRKAALRQVSVVLAGALFALSGILPLAFGMTPREKRGPVFNSLIEKIEVESAEHWDSRRRVLSTLVRKERYSPGGAFPVPADMGNQMNETYDRCE